MSFKRDYLYKSTTTTYIPQSEPNEAQRKPTKGRRRRVRRRKPTLANAGQRRPTKGLTRVNESPCSPRYVFLISFSIYFTLLMSFKICYAYKTTTTTTHIPKSEPNAAQRGPT